MCIYGDSLTEIAGEIGITETEVELLKKDIYCKWKEYDK